MKILIDGRRYISLNEICQIWPHMLQISNFQVLWGRVKIRLAWRVLKPLLMDAFKTTRRGARPNCVKDIESRDNCNYFPFFWAPDNFLELLKIPNIVKSSMISVETVTFQFLNYFLCSHPIIYEKNKTEQT